MLNNLYNKLRVNLYNEQRRQFPNYKKPELYKYTMKQRHFQLINYFKNFNFSSQNQHLQDSQTLNHNKNEEEKTKDSLLQESILNGRDLIRWYEDRIFQILGQNQYLTSEMEDLKNQIVEDQKDHEKAQKASRQIIEESKLQLLRKQDENRVLVEQIESLQVELESSRVQILDLKALLNDLDENEMIKQLKLNQNMQELKKYDKQVMIQKQKDQLKSYLQQQFRQQIKQQLRQQLHQYLQQQHDQKINQLIKQLQTQKSINQSLLQKITHLQSQILKTHQQNYLTSNNHQNIYQPTNQHSQFLHSPSKISQYSYYQLNQHHLKSQSYQHLNHYQFYSKQQQHNQYEQPSLLKDVLNSLQNNTNHSISSSQQNKPLQSNQHQIYQSGSKAKMSTKNQSNLKSSKIQQQNLTPFISKKSAKVSSKNKNLHLNKTSNSQQFPQIYQLQNMYSNNMMNIKKQIDFDRSPSHINEFILEKCHQIEQAEFYGGFQQNMMKTMNPIYKNEEKRKNQFEDKNKDPYYSFFILSAQCIKMNSPYFQSIATVDVEQYWNQVLSKRIPINQWSQYLQTQILSKANISQIST